MSFSIRKFSGLHENFQNIGFTCRLIANSHLWLYIDIQALAAQPILRGRNVVLAAETGSGKTLAYLGPIVSQICHGITKGRYLILPLFCTSSSSNASTLDTACSTASKFSHSLLLYQVLSPASYTYINVEQEKASVCYSWFAEAHCLIMHLHYCW